MSTARHYAPCQATSRALMLVGEQRAALHCNGNSPPSYGKKGASHWAAGAHNATDNTVWVHLQGASLLSAVQVILGHGWVGVRVPSHFGQPAGNLHIIC